MSLRSYQRITQHRGHIQTVAPAVEPITKAEVKQHLELDSADTSQDSYLDILIASAREIAEEMTGLALITQTWQLTLDWWPNSREPWWDGVVDGHISELTSGSRDPVYLPRYPLQTVDTITADGNAVTISDVFIVDAMQRPGRLVLKYGAAWPVISSLSANGIVVTYTAGYGASGAAVPSALKLALLNMVAYMYANRGDCSCSPSDAYAATGAGMAFSKYSARHI